MKQPQNKAPIAYLQRTRDWYAGLGYDTPYRWVQNQDVAFCPLKKPLGKSTVALVTTAALFQPDKGDQGPGAAYNGKAKFYSVYTHPADGKPDVRISHIAYDRAHTSAADSNTWFPLETLLELQRQSKIGAVATDFFGLPTNRSQRHTIETDCPALFRAIGQQQPSVDAVILVANCPVCHQSVSLAANYLETRGIATVVMGCARDIVEHVGVPRFLFSDLPLGNAAGKPFDTDSQRQNITLAIELLGNATAARSTVQSPVEWSESHAWKQDYCNIALLTDEEVSKRRAEFDRQKIIAKVQRAR